LWGSFQLVGITTRQRLIGMMVVFNFMWSCATADEFGPAKWIHIPAFVFLALASAFTAFCVFSKRSLYGRRGAALLTLAFSLWAVFLVCSPFLEGSRVVLYFGFMAASVLQLFIAISMMVMVLDETRGKLQSAVDNFGKEVHRSSQFRTEAESARESYRLLFENSKEAVAIVGDDDLEILDLNGAARKLFALKDRAAGLCLTSFCSLPNKKTDAKTLAAALPKSPEIEMTLADGSKVHARVRSQTIQHAGRKAHQILFSDVAERSSLARQLRGNGKLSALGQVISGVAHELNNPLASIKGYTDLLLLTSALDPQTRAALTKVSLESNRAARLVQDLLAFARPEAPRIEPLRLNDTVEKFAAVRRADIEAKGITVDLDLEIHSELVLASGEQLQQVLAHLLNNAVDAVEEQEGERTILVSSRSAEGKVQIRVEDNGPGVEAEILPRIFEPFFTTKPVGTGTGLGLSLCYSIVMHHKGKIWYEASALGGACFVVELPLAFAASESKSKITTAEFRPKNVAVKRSKLLVVDDEPTVVSLLNDMLTLVGHQVSGYTSPQEALAALRSDQFDAVLSDFRMPGMNGGELYEQAVAHDLRYQNRFLFLTGDMMDSQTNEFFESAKVPFLLKPFQLSALQSGLAGVLGRDNSDSAAAIAG
jgi:two-component system NtrC family sensor kinase